ncbi:LysR family transcriptional regulator [Palleronia sp. LCG004]|uniref:LysR family transcriptional regulator n=1 Tax=Palleronia sp. LCG004 TaxID=3079304 RepID=UPI00294351A5|nr:LysR substrate-binding domain-containing protein [Palleronia sp. LCG004]WOI57664.1 LysR substrate-binding domain-containing protein [Palleronia sp. LCG004]
MMDLKPIRVFLKVARQKSFAQAARNLRMTPASVTRIVARLETDLGQQLLVRTSRQVALTSSGALIAARYGPVIAEFDRISVELERSMLPDRGTLTISTPMSFGQRVMPRLARAFGDAYPAIELRLHMADRLVDIVSEGIDLAIRISAPPTDKSSIWRRICVIPRRVIAAPTLFDRTPRPTAPDDLDPALCMSYGHGPETWRFRQGALKRDVTAGTAIVCNNGDVLSALAVSGTGLALLPDFITAPDLATGALEPVLPDWTASPLWLAVHYPPYETLPPLVATFTDFFEAFLRDLDGFDFA